MCDKLFGVRFMSNMLPFNKCPGGLSMKENKCNYLELSTFFMI